MGLKEWLVGSIITSVAKRDIRKDKKFQREMADLNAGIDYYTREIDRELKLMLKRKREREKNAKKESK